MDEYEQARHQVMNMEKVGNSEPEWKCTYCGKAGHGEDSCFKKTKDQGRHCLLQL